MTGYADLSYSGFTVRKYFCLLREYRAAASGKNQNLNSHCRRNSNPSNLVNDACAAIQSMSFLATSANTTLTPTDFDYLYSMQNLYGPSCPPRPTGGRRLQGDNYRRRPAAPKPIWNWMPSPAELQAKIAAMQARIAEIGRCQFVKESLQAVVNEFTCPVTLIG